jgi:hypothetical protein
MINFWKFLSEAIKKWWVKMIITCLLIIIGCVIQHFFPLEKLLIPTIETIETIETLEKIG